MENVRGRTALVLPASRLLRAGGVEYERPTRIPPLGSTPGYGTILGPNRSAEGGNRGGHDEPEWIESQTFDWLSDISSARRS